MRSETRGIGFLNDARRLNVALTRAKCSLFILGRAEALTRSSLWGELIADAKARHCFEPYDYRFWNAIQNLYPRNIYQPRHQQEQQKQAQQAAPKAIEPPTSYKIKTPMQRRREEMAQPVQPAKK